MVIGFSYGAKRHFQQYFSDLVAVSIYMGEDIYQYEWTHTAISYMDHANVCHRVEESKSQKTLASLKAQAH